MRWRIAVRRSSRSKPLCSTTAPTLARAGEMRDIVKRGIDADRDRGGGGLQSPRRRGRKSVSVNTLQLGLLRLAPRNERETWLSIDGAWPRQVHLGCIRRLDDPGPFLAFSFFGSAAFRHLAVASHNATRMGDRKDGVGAMHWSSSPSCRSFFRIGSATASGVRTAYGARDHSRGLVDRLFWRDRKKRPMPSLVKSVPFPGGWRMAGHLDLSANQIRWATELD